MQRKTNNSILVPIDFSDAAENALKHAVAIAKLYRNAITLLYVLKGTAFGSLLSGNQIELIEDALKLKLELKAKELASSTQLTVTARIEKGKVYKTIAKIANSESFDSIIMGSNGASGLEQIIGSNSSKTIQLSEVPVVVVKQNTMGVNGYKKIVLPIDLSIESRQKIDWAIYLGKKFNSEVHVIYTKSNDEYLSRKIELNINLVNHHLKESGIQFLVSGLDHNLLVNFATKTLKYSNAIKADLILVMTHTEKEVSEIVIGTLTQQLVNRSEKIPIMCIHPHQLGYTYDY
ncbi:MAG: hypothetical protein CK532_06395 [Flavobacteriales bacterium]|nr:MAG: hypothetical protein CK532_06395 [Flavobacteriales bacterium]